MGTQFPQLRHGVVPGISRRRHARVSIAVPLVAWLHGIDRRHPDERDDAWGHPFSAAGFLVGGSLRKKTAAARLLHRRGSRIGGDPLVGGFTLAGGRSLLLRRLHGGNVPARAVTSERPRARKRIGARVRLV